MIYQGLCAPCGVHNAPCHVWLPVIEGSLIGLLSSVIRVDARLWPDGTHLRIEAKEAGLNKEWFDTVLNNSPILNAAYITQGSKVTAMRRT